MAEVPAKIRLARPDEAARVHAVMKAAFDEYRAQPMPSSALLETVHDVREAVGRGGAVLGFDGSAAVASGRFGWRIRDDGTRTLFYERLAVLPSHRRRGIGRAMIAWLEEHARGGGARVVEVTVRSQQPDNRPYYQALGYRITGYSGRYGIADIRTHMEKLLCAAR